MGKIIKSIGEYFKDARSELRKVVFPTFKQVVNNTIVVIITMLVIGSIIWTFDFGFSTARKYLIETYVTVSEPEIPYDEITVDDTEINLEDILTEENFVVEDDSVIEDNQTPEGSLE